MRAAHALLQALQACGVDRIFGLPGSTEAPLLDALLDVPEMHYVLGLHESIVVGMADGYARATGRPAIANLHTTVGTGNGLTALFNAWKDGSPVVAIATHKHSEILSRDGFCVGPDLAQWARPVTKWAWQGIHPHQVAAEVMRAYKVAGAAPAAPVYLCYPEDLLGQPVPESTVPQWDTTYEDEAWPAPSVVERLAQILTGAQHPIMIAGDEVSRTGATDLVAALAERLQIPLFQESRRSAVQWNVATTHPCYGGEYRAQNPRVQAADVILAWGCRLSVEFSPVKVPDVPPGAQLIHVHRDNWEVGKNYPPVLGVVASVRATAIALGEWLDRHAGAWNPIAAELPAPATPTANLSGSHGLVTPAALAQALARIAPPQTAVVDEAIRSSPALLAHFPLRPGLYFHSSGGGLGWGLPAALGIQMAWPQRPVLAVIGDGSLLFAIQALWTAVHEQLPVKIVVPNNRKYLAVKAGLVEYDHQAVASNRFPGVDLTPPDIDFVAVAAGFGVSGRQVTRPEELEGHLAWAFDTPGPVLVDVLIEEDLRT